MVNAFYTVTRWGGGGGAAPAREPEHFELVIFKIVIESAKGLWMGGVGQRETADIFQAGQVVEEGLDQMGDGGVAPGTPSARVAIGLVLDGNGDLTHVGSWRVGATSFRRSENIVLPGDAIIGKWDDLWGGP